MPARRPPPRLPAWLLLALLGSCSEAPHPLPEAGPRQGECLEEYEPGRDYFPHKSYPQEAEGFRIEYRGFYKVLSVEDPGGGEAVYLLTLCGAPDPPAHASVPRIQIPVGRLATTSTTELPHVVALGLGDRLVGHDELDYIVAPELRRRAAAGRLQEIGAGEGLDLERILEAEVDLLLVDSPTRAGGSEVERLRSAGVAVVAVPSFLEASPLGRAEWVKLLAYFFGREEEAEEIFAGIVRRYRELAALGRGAARQPTVLTSAPLAGTWYLPGGRSFLARLLADAGAEYLWAEDESVGSLALDLEAVIERAVGAEVWLHPSDWASLAEVRANDPRLAGIAAFRTGRVYGNDARLGPAGGNDYWEQGSARPDLVLADLLVIFHPELAPGHELYFHRRLQEEG